jgi:hypothetical protein
MKAAPRRVTRRFPDYGWAWPTGGLDLLLKAVLLADEERALAAGLSWLAAHDLDSTAFREQRLLAALSDRFGRRLSSSPAYPRLVGLQRLLWTRSRMALRDSSEALDALSKGAIPFMFIKGASRVALDPNAQRGRVSHDIDILVRKEHMRAAFAVLLDGGWQATSGAGLLRLKVQAEACRAMNFFKGEFGDVDLHSLAYHPAHADEADEAALWPRSVPAVLAGIGARAPAASDRIALAIAHGALDAHTHSDWLVDVDACIRNGRPDWRDLLDTLRARRICVPAASALSYLAQETGCPVPPDALRDIVEVADHESPGRRLALLECKPRTDFTPPTALARGIVKQIRLLRGKRLQRRAREAVWRCRIARPATDGTGRAATSADLPAQISGAVRFRISLTVELPKRRRRIDWELSTPTRHLAVLRYRTLLPFGGLRGLTFAGSVTLGEGETRLLLSARPSRFLRAGATDDEVETHGPVPFVVTWHTARPAGFRGSGDGP